MGKSTSRKDAIEAIEKRKALRSILGNKCGYELRAILDYLYSDVTIDMIMKCDIAEIECAINHIESGMG